MDDLTAKIIRVLERAPEFMKQELLSKDPVVRSRAEETLSAMIAAALAPDTERQDTYTKSREC